MFTGGLTLTGRLSGNCFKKNNKMLSDTIPRANTDRRWQYKPPKYPNALSDVGT